MLNDLTAHDNHVTRCDGWFKSEYLILVLQHNTVLPSISRNHMTKKLTRFSGVTRVDVSETFSADQLWFRILSGLFQRCSLPENLWTALIQLWTALKTEIFRAKNQRWNSAVQLWNRADSELNSADFLWNSSETGNFQSKKISAESELFQRWFSLKQSWFSLKQRWNTKFSEQKNQRWIRAVSALIFSETELNSADFLWHSAEKPKIQSKKNQLWISAVSALIFPETELITTEAFWNSSYHSWFSPETTLNIPQICLIFLVLTGLLQFFSRET